MSTAIESFDKDRREVYLHEASKVVQATALVAPPATLAVQLYRKNFTISRWLRNSAAWTFVFGTSSGLALAWLRLRNESDNAIYARAYKFRHSASQVRLDDYSKVGSVLGALLTTTVFLRRTNLAYNVLGGAALGIGGGVITHIVKGFQEGGSRTGADKAKGLLPNPTEVVDEVVQGKK